MPEEAIWTLIVSLVVLAIGTTLKAAELSHKLKSANEDIARLRSKLNMAQDEIKKLASNESKLKSSIENEFSKARCAHDIEPEDAGPVLLEFTNQESQKIKQGVIASVKVYRDGRYYAPNHLLCREHKRELKPDRPYSPDRYECSHVGCKVSLRPHEYHRATGEAIELACVHIRTEFHAEPYSPGPVYG